MESYPEPNGRKQTEARKSKTQKQMSSSVESQAPEWLI
jgi:hypothetical protein